MIENESLDKKSLRLISGTNPDWKEIAKDCVAFANAYGGRIMFGIEDDDDQPPVSQRIPSHLLQQLVKRVQGLTINVGIVPRIVSASNEGEYIELMIHRNASSIASTSDGKYYIRIGDESKPVLPDELSRLINEKGAFVWETQLYLVVPSSDCDSTKLDQFINDIQDSDRVSDFVKGKSPLELLEHYFMARDGNLTNLGILWVGKREHRARLLYAPSIQFIKYDENQEKVRKLLWDQYDLNPKELIQAVWREVQDWREGIEITDGLFRKQIPNYDEVVVRELLANALVHRPYTTRGDIFINLFPDRVEFHNPGLLPIGVTTSNILHKSVQRNPHLAKVFYDLQLMEKEGSGYDRMYENLLSQGKPVPVVRENRDRVVVSVEKRIVNKHVIAFLEKVGNEIILRSKELISLGLIAQHNGLTALEFASILGLEDGDEPRTWLGRLLDFGLVKKRGKTKGTTYFVEPGVLVRHDFSGLTNLRNIEPHRLKQLIIEDLHRYGQSAISAIHQRIGTEIPEHKVRDILTSSEEIGLQGEKRGRVYYLKNRPE